MHHSNDPYRSTPSLYALGQVFYYSSMAIIGGYTTVYLSSKGVSDSHIGFVISIATVTAIIIQLALSSALDKYPKTLSKTPVILLSFLSGLSVALMLIFPAKASTIIILYTIALTLDKSASSLMSTISVKSNIHITYAIPRMLGSAAYATTCLVFGKVIDRYGPSYLMYIYVPFCVITAIFMTLMPEDHIVTAAPKRDCGGSSYFSIIKENRILRVFLIAIVILGIGHTSCLTFLIRVIEECGGGSAQLGITMSIQSFCEVPMLILMATALKNKRSDRLLIITFSAYVVRIMILAFARNIFTVYFVATMNMLCVGISSAATINFTNLISHEDEKARCQALTILAGGGGVGGVIGTSLSGILLDTFGTRTTFLIGGTICLAALLVMVYCSSLYGKTLEGRRRAVLVHCN